ncbi:hypothetical protein EDB89DRAFT_2124365 [Lactarius sanguifluus]|nr:hypothetical protein EDB89DRAFT_2124365 [Lactarius sanguifluus]
MPLLLTSPSEGTSSEPAPRQREGDRDHDLWTSYPSTPFPSSSRPPRRSPCKMKKQRGQGQLMAYVLVRPSRPARASRTICRLSNGPAHASAGQQPREKRGQGNKSGLKELVHEEDKDGKRDGGCGEYEDDEEVEKDKSKSKTPTPLDQALAEAFTHNSMNPNVTASVSAPAATSGSCVAALKGEAPSTHAEQSTQKMTAPRGRRAGTRRLRRLLHIIVDTPRKLQRVPKAKPQSHPPARLQPRHKPGRSTQQHRTSTPPAIYMSISIHMSMPELTPRPQEQSSPITPSDVNSLADLPLTILPEPARTVIAIPPRALSHLHSLPDPPDPVRKLQETQQYAIQQGFCYEGAAVGAYGPLATSPAAEPSPVSDSGACAITTNFASATDPDDLQDTSLYLDISMGLADSRIQTQMHTRSKTTSYPRSPGRHFCAWRHDGVDHSPGAGVDVGRTLTNPSQCLSFNIVSPDHGGEGWTEWRAENVFGGAGASTDTGAGDPGKFGDDPSSPVRVFGGVKPSGAMDEDDEEEGDVMGMLFENTSDDDFVPPSGLGKGRRG